MHLHIVKARLLQIRLQLGVLVDGHAADDLRPLLVLVRVAVALVATGFNKTEVFEDAEDTAKKDDEISKE